MKTAVQARTDRAAGECQPGPDASALQTSDGIILIDPLNTQVEAAALIEGGTRKLGLDPAQIKYIVVTRGHGDHYGGLPTSRRSTVRAW